LAYLQSIFDIFNVDECHFYIKNLTLTEDKKTKNINLIPDFIIEDIIIGFHFFIIALTHKNAFLPTKDFLNLVERPIIKPGVRLQFMDLLYMVKKIK
jgi:hypothetical protein